MRWVIGVGSVLTLVTFLGVSWRLLRFVFTVDRHLPTLLNIARQFESNGGSTLRDKIEYLHGESRVVLRIAEDSRLIAQTNAAIVDELSRTQTNDLQHIKEYLHERLHDVANSTAAAAYAADMNDRRAARIEERLDRILQPKEHPP